MLCDLSYKADAFYSKYLIQFSKTCSSSIKYQILTKINSKFSLQKIDLQCSVFENIPANRMILSTNGKSFKKIKIRIIYRSFPALQLTYNEKVFYHYSGHSFLFRIRTNFHNQLQHHKRYHFQPRARILQTHRNSFRIL